MDGLLLDAPCFAAHLELSFEPVESLRERLGGSVVEVSEGVEDRPLFRERGDILGGGIRVGERGLDLSHALWRGLVVEEGGALNHVGELLRLGSECGFADSVVTGLRAGLLYRFGDGLGVFAHQHLFEFGVDALDAVAEEVGDALVGPLGCEILGGLVAWWQGDLLACLPDVLAFAHPCADDRSVHAGDFADLHAILKDIVRGDPGELGVAPHPATHFGREDREDAVEFAEGLQDLRAADLRVVGVGVGHRGEFVGIPSHELGEFLLGSLVDFEPLVRASVHAAEGAIHPVDLGLAGYGVVGVSRNNARLVSSIGD